MKKIYWPMTIIFMISFFYFFWRLEAPKPIDNKVKLSINLEPNVIKPLEKSEDGTILIKLRAENPTTETYSSKEYFYRIVLSRSPYPYSPGFVIKEYAKDLKPQSVFEKEFSWELIYLQNEKAKLFIHFNLYKRNFGKEPILVSVSSYPLYVNMDPPR